MSLPIAAATVGMPELAHIDANLSVARRFQPLTPKEMESLPAGISSKMRAAIDRFFADHIDC